MAGRTGFRVDTTRLRAKLRKVNRQVKAAEFKPELMDFTRRSLIRAANDTPVREYDIIRENQNRQYDRRINCIPTSHELVNPSLRVKEDGSHWMYLDGKWFLANKWNLSAHAQNEYDSLLMERERRMSTPRARFISNRAQARFLYRKSWSKVGESLGLEMRKINSISRHNPPNEPPKAYGQWRGGKTVLSVVVFNRFLEQPSRYKNFSGREIIGRAMVAEQPRFQRRFSVAFKRVMKSTYQ